MKVLSIQRFVEPSQVGILILSNSIYCGVNLVQIDLPERCAMLGLVREGQFIPANANPTVYCGDYLLGIAIHPMMVPALKVMLKKTHDWQLLFSEIHASEQKNIRQNLSLLRNICGASIVA